LIAGFFSLHAFFHAKKKYVLRIISSLFSVLLIGVGGRGPAGAGAAQESLAQRVHLDFHGEDPALIQSGEENDDGKRVAHDAGERRS
jgi:hypothetical protein